MNENCRGRCSTGWRLLYGVGRIAQPLAEQELAIVAAGLTVPPWDDDLKAALVAMLTSAEAHELDRWLAEFPITVARANGSLSIAGARL